MPWRSRVRVDVNQSVHRKGVLASTSRQRFRSQVETSLLLRALNRGVKLRHSSAPSQRCAFGEVGPSGFAFIKVLALLITVYNTRLGGGSFTSLVAIG